MYTTKQVYTDYEITDVTGDGNCLFRAVAHVAAGLECWHPDDVEEIQEKLAVLLRRKVDYELLQFQMLSLDSIVKQLQAEWMSNLDFCNTGRARIGKKKGGVYIEGDFDEYTRSMSELAWGGEPELLMLSHVLGMPIIVFRPCNIMSRLDGVTPIAHYGQQYSEHPITVLYVRECHYDALKMQTPNTGTMDEGPHPLNLLKNLVCMEVAGESAEIGGHITAGWQKGPLESEIDDNEEHLNKDEDTEDTLETEADDNGEDLFQCELGETEDRADGS